MLGKRVATIIIMLVLLSTLAQGVYAEGKTGLKGVTVVVTFSNLKYDIEPLLCPVDNIEYIVPPGVDPHDYQLTEKDIELLQKADIIISTAHTHFELKIREMYKDEKVIIEVPFIDNITLLINPVTNNYNYHMPIYDPFNYIVFIKNVAEVLSKLNPSCKSVYEINSLRIIERTKELVRLVEDSNKTYIAVGDKPYIQYGVSWLNIKIIYLLVREHGVPVTARDYEYVRSLIEDRKIDLVIVTYPVIDKASKYLLEQARSNGIPALLVPSPISRGSIVEKLENITRQFLEIRGFFKYTSTRYQEEAVKEDATQYLNEYIKIVVSVTLVVVVIILTYYYHRRRVRCTK